MHFVLINLITVELNRFAEKYFSITYLSASI